MSVCAHNDDIRVPVCAIVAIKNPVCMAMEPSSCFKDVSTSLAASLYPNTAAGLTFALSQLLPANSHKVALTSRLKVGGMYLVGFRLLAYTTSCYLVTRSTIIRIFYYLCNESLDLFTQCLDL